MRHTTPLKASETTTHTRLRRAAAAMLNSPPRTRKVNRAIPMATNTPTGKATQNQMLVVTRSRDSCREPGGNSEVFASKSQIAQRADATYTSDATHLFP